MIKGTRRGPADAQAVWIPGQQLHQYGGTCPARKGTALRVRADLYSVDLAVTVGKQLFGLDLLGDLPAAQALLQRLNENPHVKAIAAKRDTGLPAFVAAVRARLQGAS
jgi:glutathione S-transferase